MSYIFDKNTILFSWAGIGTSFLEVLAVVTTLVSVIEAARERKSTWIWGFVSSGFYFLLFYQSQLYSDCFLQIFFAGTSVFGIWRWLNPHGPEESKGHHQLKIRRSSGTMRLFWLGIIGFCTIAMGFTMSHIHTLLPLVFPAPAAFPFPDAFVTIASVTAQILLTQKRIETWIVWIVVDICSTILFFSRGLYLAGAEYFCLIFLAAYGLFGWMKEWRRQEIK